MTDNIDQIIYATKRSIEKFGGNNVSEHDILELAMAIKADLENIARYNRDNYSNVPEPSGLE